MTGLELTDLISRFGKMMLQCGGEVYRVEDSIERICSAYGYDDIDIFAIPHTLIVTIMQDDIPITRMNSIKGIEVNMEKVRRLNALSRLICATKPTFESVNNRLDRIEKLPKYSPVVIFICYFVAAGAYSLFFGGGIRESISAGIAGVVVKFLLDFSGRAKAGVLFSKIVCAGVAATLAMILARIGFAHNYDKVIIGALMTLVPGVTLTNGARDFIAGDFIAGMYNLAEALLTAIGIATGVAVAVGLLNGVGGIL